MARGNRMTRQQYETLKVQDFDRLEARIAYLERLFDRAYPLLHNPYTQQTDPLAATTYDTIIGEVEIVIQHLQEEDDPERANLPCASCDGDGCPNCAIDAILRASDAGPQPDEMVRLQMAVDAVEEQIDRLQGRLKIAATAFDTIEQDLGRLLGLTRTEQKIEATVKLARRALED